MAKNTRPIIEILRRKQDGWYVSNGGNHTAIPKRAMRFKGNEAQSFLKEYGRRDYDLVPLSKAKEVV